MAKKHLKPSGDEENISDSSSESNDLPNPENGKAIAVTPKKKKKAVRGSNEAQPSVKSGTKRRSEGTSAETHAKKHLKRSGDEENITDFSSEPEDLPNPGKGKAIAVTPTKKKKAVRGSDEAQPSVKSGTKRRGEGTSAEAHAKRAKKVSEEDSKKPHFQRLWREEDEITLLQGMIDYKTDTGKKEGFYESLKESISFEVSKNQFTEKIRKLKEKYMVKGSLWNVHDENCFELCMRIWGPEGFAVESGVKSNGVLRMSERIMRTKNVESLKRKKKAEDDSSEGADVEESPLGGVKKSDWFHNSSLVRSIESLGGVDADSVYQRWSSVPIETRRGIEKEWKSLQAVGFDYVSRKIDLLHKVTSVIAEAS